MITTFRPFGSSPVQPQAESAHADPLFSGGRKHKQYNNQRPILQNRDYKKPQPQTPVEQPQDRKPLLDEYKTVKSHRPTHSKLLAGVPTVLESSDKPAGKSRQRGGEQAKSTGMGRLAKTFSMMFLLMSAGATGASARPLERSGANTRGLLSDCSGNSMADALQKLECPPFPPTNTSMFTTMEYPDTPPMVPAAPYTLNETNIVTQLRNTLRQRFENNETEVAEGLAIYNDPDLVQIVPDVRLRAGLAHLKGTAGEAAVDALKSGLWESVEFTSPQEEIDMGPGVIAWGLKPANDDKLKIQFNSRYQYEDPRLFTSTMAHETLHQDIYIAPLEEEICGALDTIIYAQQLREDPTLAQSGTEMNRRYNTKLMARLNSRDKDGSLRIYEAQGNVFPGGEPLDNFGDAYIEHANTTATPGNPTLQKIFEAVTGVEVQYADFDTGTYDVIDHNQAALSPEDIVQVAEQALKLNTTCTPANAPAAAPAAAPAPHEGRRKSPPHPMLRRRQLR